MYSFFRYKAIVREGLVWWGFSQIRKRNIQSIAVSRPLPGIGFIETTIACYYCLTGYSPDKIRRAEYVFGMHQKWCLFSQLPTVKKTPNIGPSYYVKTLSLGLNLIRYCPKSFTHLIAVHSRLVIQKKTTKCFKPANDVIPRDSSQYLFKA